MFNPMKSRLNTILLATDLFENSLLPLHCAITIASACSAKLLIVHVLSPSEVDTMDSSSSDLGRRVAVVKEELKTISHGLLAAKNINAEIIVRYGNVRDVLFAVQQEYSAELVIAGSSGMKTGHGKTLGSVVESILRGMPCGVIIVGPNVKRNLLESQTASILAPIAFDGEFSLTALPTAVSLATKFSAKLILLHVVDSFHSGLDCSKQMEDLQIQIHHQNGLVTEGLVLEGSVAKLILSSAKEKGADLIVMSVRQGDLEDGTRLRGTVSDIIREAPCPVLSLPKPIA